ncbi:hypothetical protein [Polymorphospora sp. NPDC050346]|uniref:hypothetical protein n=1 Tax=Polymorphospora sp. NPDC050346 TaxID=3155780 RepID=UPI0033EE45EC
MSPTVEAVAGHLGAEEVRDFAAANIHTYYVIIGDTLVLMHNANACGGPSVPTAVRWAKAGRLGRLARLLGTNGREVMVEF